MLKKYLNNPDLFLFFGVLIFGFFLRTFKIVSNYYFSGELGKELLFVYQFAKSGGLPLQGMATSHPWLNYGPFYYWIILPIYKLGSGNPFILFWVSVVVSMLGLIASYFVVKKIFNQKVALISFLIQSVSPLFIWQTRLSKLHVFFFLLIPLLTFLCYKLWQGNKKYVLSAGFCFGLLFSFHFSQLPLIAVIAGILIIKKKFFNWVDWVKLFAGVLVPNITLLPYLWKLGLWVPYRVIYTQDKTALRTYSGFAEYFGKNIFWDSKYWVAGFAIILFLVGYFVFKNYRKIKTSFPAYFFISSTLVILLANLLHGNPPAHYFLPIFTIIPVIIAWSVARIKYWYVLLMLVFVINLFAFKKDPLFYGAPNFGVSYSDFMPYSAIDTTARFIVAYTNGSEYSVRRMGAYDYFPENYSQNYKYLILFYGGNLIDNSQNVYTIIENKDGINVQH